MKRKGANDSPGLLDTIKRYIDLKAEYYSLSLAEKVSLVIGRMAFMVIMAILGLVMLLLLIALIHTLLVQWIAIQWLVIVIEIGFVLLLISIIWFGRKKIVIDPIASSFIRNMLEKNEEKEEEDDEDEE